MDESVSQTNYKSPDRFTLLFEDWKSKLERKASQERA
jgi:hypothetical protein